MNLFNDEGRNEIKISLPIFGQSTTDILGEIDTYFNFNYEFNPVLKMFEVQEFNGRNMKSVGTKLIQ